MSAARAALATEVVLRLDDEVGELPALPRQRREHGVGVGRQLRERAVLAREDLKHLVGVAERRDWRGG